MPSTPVQPEIQEGKLLDFILGVVKESLDARREWEALHDEFVKRFEALRSVMSLDSDVAQRPWLGASNLGVPVDSTAVYTILARLVRAVFGLSPIMNARPGGPRDVPLVPVIERFMHWQITEEMRAFIDFYVAMEGSLVGGSRVGKTVWERDEITWEEDTAYLVSQQTGRPKFEDGTRTPLEVEANAQPVVDPVTGEMFVPTPSRASRSTVVYDGPRLYIRPIKQIIVSQDADHPDPSKLDWICDEYWQPFSWFLAKEKAGLLLPGVIDKLRSMKDGKRSREKTGVSTAPGIQPMLQTNRFHVHEWHGKFEDQNGDEHELVALTLPDEKVLAAWMPNWYYRRTGRRQFVHWCPIPRPHSFYGRGIPEMLRGIRSILDAFINAGVNRGHLLNNPPVLYNELTSGYDPQRHRFGTGVSWGLRQIDQVRMLEIPRSEQSAMLREEMLFALVQRLLGVSDFSLGSTRTAGLPTGGAASTTYGGIASLINESNIRFDMVIKLFQEWTHPELARQLFYHNRFNPRPGKVFRVTESGADPFQTVEPELFGANPDFLFRGNSSNTNKAQEREDALLLYKVFLDSKNPYIVDDKENLRRLTQGVLNPFDRQDLQLKPYPELVKENARNMVIERTMVQQAQIALGMGLGGVPAGAEPTGRPTNGAPTAPARQ